MERGTKRKRDDNDVSFDESEDGSLRTRNCDAAAQAQDGDESLLMKLPAELRNEIYELALLPVDEGDDTYIGDINSHYGSPRVHSPWKEPGLLMVAKTIRSEAMPVYYLSQNFFITADCNDIESLWLWLAQLVQRLEGHWPKFSVVVLKEAWCFVHQWLHLGLLAYESSSVLADGRVTTKMRLETEY
ncbi:hypothetical protein LTR09_009504 [Extremus antarcticus]|uniref:Uncharacterized protein n=1 Tax=Extremus antarcticus TaxID=702011 RepID=A0AAJ0D8Q3_9PEZI|nr:hypothetical protein LTR09_009504 [Extremus antarcticus]